MSTKPFRYKPPRGRNTASAASSRSAKPTYKDALVAEKPKVIMPVADQARVIMPVASWDGLGNGASWGDAVVGTPPKQKRRPAGAAPVVILASAPKVAAPPVETSPAAPVEAVPAPPVETSPAAPVEAVPAPPVETRPAPPMESGPAPPMETRPAPPVAGFEPVCPFSVGDTVLQAALQYLQSMSLGAYTLTAFTAINALGEVYKQYRPNGKRRTGRVAPLCITLFGLDEFGCASTFVGSVVDTVTAAMSLPHGRLLATTVPRFTAGPMHMITDTATSTTLVTATVAPSPFAMSPPPFMVGCFLQLSDGHTKLPCRCLAPLMLAAVMRRTFAGGAAAVAMEALAKDVVQRNLDPSVTLCGYPDILTYQDNLECQRLLQEFGVVRYVPAHQPVVPDASQTWEMVLRARSDAWEKLEAACLWMASQPTFPYPAITAQAAGLSTEVMDAVHSAAVEVLASGETRSGFDAYVRAAETCATHAVSSLRTHLLVLPYLLLTAGNVSSTR